ncbi:DNA glycosylase [Xylaria sp. FL0043]|nr:DNA glycosylase [Xylaria sp. FL0043]
MYRHLYLCTARVSQFHLPRRTLTTVMARASRDAKVKASGDLTDRRRSARHATIEKDDIGGEQEIKSENGDSMNGRGKDEETPPKATAKRGRLRDSDLSSATELRRSKRVKPDNASKKPADTKSEKRDEKKVKKHIKHDDDESPPVAASPPPIKAETDDKNENLTSKPVASKAKTTTADLQAKKLKSYSQFAAARQSPYPDFPHPTPAECKLAHEILISLHGARVRPEATVAPATRAGCGDSASVLDALVRTILSQNTSDKNSTRAKLAMDRAYGGSDAWARIVEGGQAKLAKTIESGGLAVVKSKVILDILAQTREKYGVYSLDHLFGASDEDAMREMLSFKGVGPKTASCVLLFCLKRDNFAVDTHVHRITGLLGWRPVGANRDQTHAHLDARIPDEEKYGLHVLLIKHGKECEECRAGGKNLGRCALRRAFRKGKIEGRAGSEVKREEEEHEQQEEEEQVEEAKEEEEGQKEEDEEEGQKIKAEEDVE